MSESLRSSSTQRYRPKVPLNPKSRSVRSSNTQQVGNSQDSKELAFGSTRNSNSAYITPSTRAHSRQQSGSIANGDFVNGLQRAKQAERRSLDQILEKGASKQKALQLLESRDKISQFSTAAKQTSDQSATTYTAGFSSPIKKGTVLYKVRSNSQQYKINFRGEFYPPPQQLDSEQRQEIDNIIQGKEEQNLQNVIKQIQKERHQKNFDDQDSEGQFIDFLHYPERKLRARESQGGRGVITR